MATLGTQDPQSPHLDLNILHANCKSASLCLSRAFLEGGNLARACMLLCHHVWHKQGEQQYLLNRYKEAGSWQDGTIQVIRKLVRGPELMESEE